MKTAPFIKKTLAWLVVSLGILFGIFVLSGQGAQDISPLENQWFLLAWFAPGFALGAVSIAGSWTAIWNPKLAGLTFLLATPVILISRLPWSFRRFGAGREIAWILLPFLSFGFFWLLTSQTGWPRLAAQPGSARRKVAFGVLTFFPLGGLVVIGSAVIAMLPQHRAGDCGPPPAFAVEQYKGQIVFSATFRKLGIAAVKESFWGLPAGGHRFVLIAHWGIVGHSQLDGRTFFIEGRRMTGLITRFLPIVDVSHCSRFRPIEKAALDLRLVREGPSPNAVHIVGQVKGRDNQARLGAKCEITGPVGSVETTTDSEGLFDLKDLPPGHYAVRVEGCDANENPVYFRCIEGSDLKAGDVWGVELRSN